MLPHIVLNIIFYYIFPPYRDLEITDRMRDFLLYFFQDKMDNELKYVANHLVPLFNKYKVKCLSLGRDYWHMNDHNFEIDLYRTDETRKYATKKMRLEVYKLNKSRDSIVRKLQKIFPSIIYFQKLELRAGKKNASYSNSHIL